MKSLSFRNHSLNGKRGWRGRASSWAAARTGSGLCRGGIAVPGEPWAGLGGPGRAREDRVSGGHDRPRPSFSPTLDSAPPGLPQCPHWAVAPAPALRRPRLARSSLCPSCARSGGLAPTFGCEPLCCAPSPSVGSSGLCLIPPSSPSFPSLHPWQRSLGPRTAQPERSILSGWC